MFLIAMLELNFQPIRNGICVQPIGRPNVVTFEGFNKTLGHPIALGALHRSPYWSKSQGSGKGQPNKSSSAGL
jgi:hypothetical protein